MPRTTSAARLRMPRLPVWMIRSACWPRYRGTYSQATATRTAAPTPPISWTVYGRRKAASRRKSAMPPLYLGPPARARMRYDRHMSTGSPASALRQLADEYTRLLGALFGDTLVSVVLFGSVARGDATPNSDIDLLIIASGLPAGRLARQDRLRDAD